MHPISIPSFNVAMVNQWISDYVRVQTTALEWAKANGLQTIDLVGGKGGRMAGGRRASIVIKDTRHGRVEEAQTLLCYALIENPERAK